MHACRPKVVAMAVVLLLWFVKQVLQQQLPLVVFIYGNRHNKQALKIILNI